MGNNRKSKVNYFGQGMDGGRYARSRPFIHPTAIEKFRSFAKIKAPLPLALDVGCGTGQSTVVLADLAERVIGIDASADMLRHAKAHPRVDYRQSTAEQIPFADGQFGLITVAQAYHWFDHDSFLAESYRLLRVPGWLLIYTSWFTSQMKDVSSFSDWFRGEYLDRYPTPPRDRTPVTEELARKNGLVFRGEEEFANEIGMTIPRFTDYQLSTTNVIAAVERGSTSFDDAQAWLHASLKPFFGDKQEKIFLFSGKLWYLEKEAG